MISYRRSSQWHLSLHILNSNSNNNMELCESAASMAAADGSRQLQGHRTQTPGYSLALHQKRRDATGLEL